MNSLRTIAKLATLVVIGGGTIGAAVGITQAQSFHEAPQSADAVVNKTRIFFSPSDNWKSDSASFALNAANYAKENADTWVRFQLYNNEYYTGEEVYYADIDLQVYPRLIFCRMKPGEPDMNWDNKWNQTSQFNNVSEGKNFFKLTNDDGWNPAIDKGTWSYLEEPIDEFQYVWAKFEKDFIAYGATPKVGAWGGDLDSYTLYDYYEKFGDYYRFKIPSLVTGMKFVRFGTDNNEWGGTVDIKNVNIENNKVYYVEYDDHTKIINYSLGAANNVSASMFRSVIEPIKTCIDSSKSGYNAYNDIKIHFYDKKSFQSDEALKTEIIKDYNHEDYFKNNKSYSGLTKTIEYSAFTKWNEIKRAYNNAHPNQSLDTNIINNNVLIAGSVTILGTSLIAGFAYLLKKKKLHA